jgi:3-deoxy-D-arabino-heptulosonate 7-phosphate (DAHP) synthase
MTFLHSHLPLDLQLLVARSSFDLSLRKDLLESQNDTLARHNVAVDSNNFIFTEHDELNLSTIDNKQVVRLPAFKPSATPSIFATSSEHRTLVSTTHNSTNAAAEAVTTTTEQAQVEEAVTAQATVEVEGGTDTIVLASVEMSGPGLIVGIISE